MQIFQFELKKIYICVQALKCFLLLVIIIVLALSTMYIVAFLNNYRTEDEETCVNYTILN